jgi:hypothetical protein
MALGAAGLLVLGGCLIWIALRLRAGVEPYCVDVGNLECVASAEEQRKAQNVHIFLLVFLPGALSIAGGIRMLFLVLDQRWPGRW